MKTHFYECSRGHRLPVVEVDGNPIPCTPCHRFCHETPIDISDLGLTKLLISAENGGDKEAERIARYLLQMNRAMRERLVTMLAVAK